MPWRDTGLPTTAVRRLPWWMFVDASANGNANGNGNDNAYNASNHVAVPLLEDASMKKERSFTSSPIPKGSTPGVPVPVPIPVPLLYRESPETMDTASTTSSFSSIPFHLPTTTDPPVGVLLDAAAPVHYSLSSSSSLLDDDDPSFVGSAAVDLGDSRQSAASPTTTAATTTVGSDIESAFEFEERVRTREKGRDAPQQQQHEEQQQQQASRSIRTRLVSQQEPSVGSERLQRLEDHDQSCRRHISTGCQEAADWDGESPQVPTNIRYGRLSPQGLGRDYAHSSVDSEPSLSIDCAQPQPPPSPDAVADAVVEGEMLCTLLETSSLEVWEQDIESMESGTLRQSENFCPLSRPRELDLNLKIFAKKDHVTPLAWHGVSPIMEPNTAAEIEKESLSPIVSHVCSSPSSVPSMYHASPETMDTATSVTVTEHTGVVVLPSPIHLRFANHEMPLKTKARIVPHQALGNHDGDQDQDHDASVDDASWSALTIGSGCSIVESNSIITSRKGGSLWYTVVANVLFGDTKYLVQTFFSHGQLYRRSYQGGASFGMATALICMQLHRHLQLLLLHIPLHFHLHIIHFGFLLPLPAVVLVVVAILPFVAVWIEVHTPHNVEEATLAVLATLLSLSIKLFTTPVHHLYNIT
jgi:hypothetical protein